MSRVITRCVWFTLTWQHCARSVLSGLHHPLLITQGLFSVCVKAVQQLLKALSKIQVQFQYSQVAVADLLLLPALVRASERTDLFLHSGRNFTDSESEDQRALWDSHKGQYWHIKDFHSQLSTRRSFYKQVSVNRLVSVSWKVAPTFTDAKSRGLQNFLTCPMKDWCITENCFYPEFYSCLFYYLKWHQLTTYMTINKFNWLF